MVTYHISRGREKIPLAESCDCPGKHGLTRRVQTGFAINRQFYFGSFTDKIEVSHSLLKDKLQSQFEVKNEELDSPPVSLGSVPSFFTSNFITAYTPYIWRTEPRTGLYDGPVWCAAAQPS